VFSYTATGAPEVYDAPTVQSGEPVFTRLTCVLELNFDYTLVAPQLANASGVRSMNAVLLDEQSGWRRTLPLIAEESFASGSFHSSASLDLCQAQALVAAVEAQTGFHQTAYTM
jgi:hypothetical protein